MSRIFLSSVQGAFGEGVSILSSDGITNPMIQSSVPSLAPSACLSETLSLEALQPNVADKLLKIVEKEVTSSKATMIRRVAGIRLLSHLSVRIARVICSSHVDSWIEAIRKIMRDANNSVSLRVAAFKWAVALLKSDLLGKKERKMIHKIMVTTIKESVCEVGGVEDATAAFGIRKTVSPIWLISIVSMLSLCPTFPRSEASFLKSFAMTAFEWGQRTVSPSLLNPFALFVARFNHSMDHSLLHVQHLFDISGFAGKTSVDKSITTWDEWSLALNSWSNVLQKSLLLEQSRLKTLRIEKHDRSITFHEKLCRIEKWIHTRLAPFVRWMRDFVLPGIPPARGQWKSGENGSSEQTVTYAEWDAIKKSRKIRKRIEDKDELGKIDMSDFRNGISVVLTAHRNILSILKHCIDTFDDLLVPYLGPCVECMRKIHLWWCENDMFLGHTVASDVSDTMLSFSMNVGPAIAWHVEDWMPQWLGSISIHPFLSRFRSRWLLHHQHVASTNDSFVKWIQQCVLLWSDEVIFSLEERWLEVLKPCLLALHTGSLSGFRIPQDRLTESHCKLLSQLISLTKECMLGHRGTHSGLISSFLRTILCGHDIHVGGISKACRTVERDFEHIIHPLAGAPYIPLRSHIFSGRQPCDDDSSLHGSATSRESRKRMHDEMEMDMRDERVTLDIARFEHVDHDGNDDLPGPHGMMKRPKFSEIHAPIHPIQAHVGASLKDLDTRERLEGINVGYPEVRKEAMDDDGAVDVTSSDEVDDIEIDVGGESDLESFSSQDDE